MLYSANIIITAQRSYYPSVLCTGYRNILQGDFPRIISLDGVRVSKKRMVKQWIGATIYFIPYVGSRRHSISVQYLYVVLAVIMGIAVFRV